MDDTKLRRGVRNAWLLTLAAVIFVVGFFLFTVKMNTPAKPEAWDMGGTPFVPASHPAAEGYYEPLAAGGQR